MDFEKFYNLVSDSDKLEYLNNLLKTNKDLQRDFKEKTNIEPIEVAEEDEQDTSFGEIVAQYSQLFEEDFSEIDYSDFDWEDIYIPQSHYVEEWELVENHFSDQIAELFVPVKDLILDKIITSQFTEVLAACCALYKVCQNIEIEDDDYCVSDSVMNDFSNGCTEVVQYISERINRVSGENKHLNDAIFQFLEYFFVEHENDSSFEKEIEELIYSLLIKSKDSTAFYKVFSKNQFKYFPKISSYLIDKNSTVDNWLDFALKSYKKDILIAEKLLIHLHKSDTEKFVTTALSLINNPIGYKEEDFYKYEIDDMYYAEYGWNEFLYPLLNYKEHGLLFIIVNLNIANRNDKIEHYLKVREYLNEAQKKKFIDVVWRNPFKIRIYIVENKLDQAKDIIRQNESKSQLISLIEPFQKLEPEFCYNFIISFIDKKIETERGRSVYSEIAELLVFAEVLQGFSAKTKEYAAKLCKNNSRLSALKDEFIKAKLI
ncbi:MAG: hypothetical protein PHW82_05435 [Bacteroidales bacterium]|nr:hypothetical protein [Bacteroidales bacterium]